MYIMKKMNREKKATNESERDALIQAGYKQVNETTDSIPEKKESPEIQPEGQEHAPDGENESPEEKKGTKKKV